MAKKTFSSLLKTSAVPVLVDFYADWCGPCQTMSPVIQRVSSNFHGKIKVIKVNVDKNQAAAQKYGVQGIPTFILFDKGQVRWRKSGAIPEQQLNAELQPFVS